MKKWILIAICILALFFIGCFFLLREPSNDTTPAVQPSFDESMQTTIDDFQIDLVYQDGTRDIHYSAYIPEHIDEMDSVSLFITLPGWEGLYFQGVGVNLEYEDFAFTARDINPNMIILAPQLNDWGEQSARDTIALTEYYQSVYPVSKTYIEGYSGGGETLSLVLDQRADLYDGALVVSSQWDGDIQNVVEQKLPIYFFIGRDDDYYGSSNFRSTYQALFDAYQNAGLSREEIDSILILDVREDDYFQEHGMSSQHAGGGLAAHESNIMNWLLTR